MALKKFKEDGRVKDLNTGEVFSARSATNRSFMYWKKMGRKKEWQNFRKQYSIETAGSSTINGIGFINPRTKNPANFIVTHEPISTVKTTSKTATGVATKTESGMKKMNIEFGPANNQDFKMTIMGTVAVRVADGFTSYDPESKTLQDVSGFTMDMGDMFYKVPTPEVKEGDLLKVKNNYGYVTEVTDNGVKVIMIDEEVEKTVISKKSPFGFNFYTKVVSIFDMNGEEESGLFGDMNPMMLMMMSNNNGGNTNGGGMFGGDMMSNMMMMSMMGKGENPFGNLFGGKKKKSKKDSE